MDRVLWSGEGVISQIMTAEVQTAVPLESIAQLGPTSAPLGNSSTLMRLIKARMQIRMKVYHKSIANSIANLQDRISIVANYSDVFFHRTVLMDS